MPQAITNFGAWADLASRLKGNFSEIGKATRQGWAEAGARNNFSRNMPKMNSFLKTNLSGNAYGNLFKPSTNMNATSKLVRLSELNHSLDSVVQFAYDDEDHDDRFTRNYKIGAGLTAAGAAGYGGYLGHKAISASGGYGANLAAGRSAFARGMHGTGLQGIAAGPGRSIGQFAGKATTGAQSALGKIFNPQILARLKGLVVHSAPIDKNEIRFDNHILEPFADGAVPNSKIIAEEFPPGLSPAAALQFPFPKLMRYLNRPQQLQQQFRGFSKIGKLVELKSKLETMVHGS